MNQDTREILDLIGEGESLKLEFKSDLKCFPDRDLIATAVSFSNTEGGDLLLGVENDGEITGLHPNHQNISGLPALIANRTNPPIAVTVVSMEVEEIKIARIIVPKSRQLVSTSEGLVLRRQLKLDGTPEAVPFYPHEFIQRQSSLGLMDPSAIPMLEVSIGELDPLQRRRIRDTIKKYGGDQSLLPLADDELDGALGLITTHNGQKYPTLSGVLFLGNEMLLRQHIPAYEVAFQVLHGTDVQVNEFLRKPFLQTFEEIELLFKARVTEEEIQVGLFRVPIPNFDRRAFREAFVNALVHRDFTRLGAVHIKLDDGGLSISNPGGFVDGVTLENLLVAPPRSRNPLLADIIKRIGVAERTGRGIDRIYEGMLRYGRPAPDYSMSDAFTVTVRMVNTDADSAFLKMIIDQEGKSGDMPLDSLIILSRLREERRLSTADLAVSVQKPETTVRATIEQLSEAGLLEAHGAGRGRTYTLSAKIYQRSGKMAEYVRQVGFNRLQQEQMVIKYIEAHGSIKREEVMDLCHLGKDQAYRLLRRLKIGSVIQFNGKGRGGYYVLKE